jgi:hypothetical protein
MSTNTLLYGSQGLVFMSKFHNKIPTDLELLSFIYNHYYEEYSSFIEEDNTRSSKIYVPIDCKVIAAHFKVDNDIIFGRLYYYLENKYRYKQDGGAWVNFFAFNFGSDSKCINFPYMASILAELADQQSKYLTTVKVSIVAIVLSIATISFTIYDKFLAEVPMVISKKN